MGGADPDVEKDRLLVLERDFEGPAAVTKRVYEIDLRRTDDAGYVEKELVVDLLDIANPGLVGTETSDGAYGVGEDFAFPMQSVEVVLQLADGRLLIGNDNNYPRQRLPLPGHAGRHRDDRARPEEVRPGRRPRGPGGDRTTPSR
ncbi:esterase-like activity of phytase family protein [Georgenia sp. SUBG003]|uniref:esterase-like activity of phytase family protein n=1 Tax=Georgenia sp. SUBG003 TaxID=1497974 RepID=UPI003AB7C120